MNWSGSRGTKRFSFIFSTSLNPNGSYHYKKHGPTRKGSPPTRISQLSVHRAPETSRVVLAGKWAGRVDTRSGRRAVKKSPALQRRQRVLEEVDAKHVQLRTRRYGGRRTNR